MKEFDLTNCKLFKNHIEIEYYNICLDLHNDYFCDEISNENNVFRLSFKQLNHSAKFQRITIQFEDVLVTKMLLPKVARGNYSLTIDNIYRGRYERDNKLYEYSPQGLAYFYIDFYEGYNFELFTSRVSCRLM